MNGDVMDDAAMGNAWTTLDPTGHRRRRIDARVTAWLEAQDTPLAAEWLGLFRAAPLPALGLAAASAIAVAATPPLIWFAGALM